MKAKISFAVRPSTAPGESAETLVPVIVDRKPPVSLTKVVENAIDRGLIVGPKTSAAEEIARGIADQIYKEFCEGRGVKFGSYFYARLYLDGTSDSDGKLTSANSINVRFVNGTGFKLTMDMFSFSNVNGGDIPGTDFLISEADGAERGVLVPDANAILNGVNLWRDGDAGTKVCFYGIDPATGEVADEPTAEVTNFETKGPNALKFAWPAALARGAAYMAVPSRSADGARWFTGTGKAATVKEG